MHAHHSLQPPHLVRHGDRVDLALRIFHDFKHPGQADEWIFFGNAGTSVRVQMTSRHFDTYLEVADPTGVVIALNDDHDGTDSFVSVQLCHTGAYKVVAGNFGYGSMQFGEYTLLLTGGDVVFDAIFQKCEAG